MFDQCRVDFYVHPHPHPLTYTPSPPSPPLFYAHTQAIAVFATSSADVVAMYHEQDGSIGILDIGKMLGAQYGSAYEYIWYVGLLTSAQASTMTTTYAGMCGCWCDGGGDGDGGVGDSGVLLFCYHVIIYVGVYTLHTLPTLPPHTPYTHSPQTKVDS